MKLKKKRGTIINQLELKWHPTNLNKYVYRKIRNRADFSDLNLVHGA